MFLPDDYIKNLSKQIDIPISLLQKTNLSNIINISDYENLTELIKILKINLLSHETQLKDFDLNPVLNKCLNADLNIVHDTLFYCLLNQNSFANLNKLLTDSFTLLSNDHDKDLLLFHLEILDVIIDVCLLTCADNFKIFDLENTVWKLLLKLLQDCNLQKKIARDIIPKYITCTKSTAILAIIWNDLKNDPLFYTFLVIVLEDFYLPKFKNESFNILEQIEFWEHIQINLNCTDLKKQSVYILKRAVNCLTNDLELPELVKWDKTKSNLNKMAWEKFFILCDISNEKQLHLIEPTFKLYNTLQPLHISWRICITKLFITHPHPSVIKYTISKILLKEWECDIPTLALGLNNNFLYELNDLKNYLKQLNLVDFKAFVLKICEIGPSPVPFYHICKAIEHYETKFDFQLASNLLITSIKVPHSYIRFAIQDSIFSFVIKSQPAFNKDMIKIIGTFYDISYLKPYNSAWVKITNLFQEPTYINKYDNINVETLDLTKENAILLVLLEEASSKNYLKQIAFRKDYLKTFLFYSYIIDATTTHNFLLVDLKIVLSLINQSTDYTIDYLEQIEYILKTYITKSTLNETIVNELNTFLMHLNSKENCPYFLLLTKQVVLAYEQFYITNQDYSELFPILLNTLFNLENSSIATYDQTIKRKLQSNCLQAKLVIEKLLFQLKINDDIFQILSEYFDKSSPDMLLSIIDALNIIINKYPIPKITKDNLEILKSLILQCEKEIFSLKSNELFRLALKKYIAILSQVTKIENLGIIAHNFCRRMFEASQTIVGIRNEVLEQFSTQLELDVLVEALLYGPILRKDQRIEFDTCALISTDETIITDSNIANPFELNRKVRSQAVCILLKLLEENEEIALEILTKLKAKYGLFAGKRYYGDSLIHFTKLRILQTFHILLPYLKNREYLLKLLGEFVFDCLVNESQQTSVKILLQWLLVRIYNYRKKKEEIIIKLLNKTKTLTGTSCTSVFPILYHLIKNKDVSINIVTDCLNLLLTYTMGQNFNIRFYAQTTIKHIYDIYLTNALIQQRYEYIYKTICDVISQTKSQKEFDMILTFTDLSLSLETIYYDIPRLTNVSPVEFLPPTHFSGCYKINIENSNDTLRYLTPNKTRIELPSEVDDGMNVQKKIDTFANTKEFVKSLGELIVVASLIDKAPNLGGLSRTCEIFGVKQYVLNNLQFVKNKEYQSLSLSSENWVDTIEVKIPELSEYLRGMKKLGYTIVGAEQTSDSKRLEGFAFEKNTVLLLGNEKEGIPPNLIHLLDQCLEVPQFGQIRSLNVHVAGAIFIWEYAKQHCKQ